MRDLCCRGLALGLLLAIGPAPVAAQSIVRVTVTDTLGAALPDANLRLLRDDAVVQSGRTAGDGTRRFALTAADTSVLVSMQKVGFVSTTRHFVVPSGKTIDVNLLVTPVAAVLDSEHISAHRTADDLLASIDTNEIARSGRNLDGLFALINKLRPRGFLPTHRRGTRACIERGVRFYINEDWVNPDQYGALSRIPSDQVLYVQFVPCYDRSIDDDHPGAAHIYVTLKPGAHYNVAGGLDLDSMETRDAGKMADSGKALRVLRGKLVGVYDDVSGDPIEGATITDVASGMRVQTTNTGTASLFFARTDVTMLGFTKTGYRPMTMVIGDPWADTIPLTVTMTPRGVSTIEAKRRSPADTVRKLLTVGFYDRRAWAPAPANAFLTASDMRGAHGLTEAATRVGRPLCESAVYLDGAFTNINAQLQAFPPAARTIDALLPIDIVAAIETYVGKEIPPQFDRWSEQGAVDAPKKSSRCVTAIWTK